MRVLVLDDDSWRELGLARALDAAPEITPVLERDLCDQTWSKSMASVILVAEASSRSDPRRSPERLRHKFPNAKILVYGDAADADSIADLLARGADGYFALQLGEENLLKAISVLARGAVWMPEQAVRAVVQQLRTTAASPAALNATERNLLRMLDEGLSNKEMAARLGVAEITVKMRLSRLYRRFNVKTRVQLLSYAVRNRLLPRH